MPLPNVNVVTAIFESYVAIRRQKEWRNKDDENKKKICLEALKDIQKAQNIYDWINLVEVLYKLEVQEDNDAKKRWFSSYRGDPYLLQTLRAARSHLLSEMKDEPEVVSYKNSLTLKHDQMVNAVLNAKDSYENGMKSIKELNTAKDIAAVKEEQYKLAIKQAEEDSALNAAKIEAFNDSKDYLTTFFTTVIKLKDPKLTTDANKLAEESFNDFIAHVKDNSRKNTICMSLLENKEQKTDENSLQPDANVTEEKNKDTNTNHVVLKTLETAKPVENKEPAAKEKTPVEKVAKPDEKPLPKKSERRNVKKVTFNHLPQEPKKIESQWNKNLFEQLQNNPDATRYEPRVTRSAAKSHSTAKTIIKAVTEGKMNKPGYR